MISEVEDLALQIHVIHLLEIANFSGQIHQIMFLMNILWKQSHDLILLIFFFQIFSLVFLLMRPNLDFIQIPAESRVYVYTRFNAFGIKSIDFSIMSAFFCSKRLRFVSGSLLVP